MSKNSCDKQELALKGEQKADSRMERAAEGRQSNWKGSRRQTVELERQRMADNWIVKTAEGRDFRQAVRHTPVGVPTWSPLQLCCRQHIHAGEACRLLGLPHLETLTLAQASLSAAQPVTT